MAESDSKPNITIQNVLDVLHLYNKSTCNTKENIVKSILLHYNYEVNPEPEPAEKVVSMNKKVAIFVSVCNVCLVLVCMIG